MGRSRLKLPDGCSFHITLRCNSRAFLIARGVRRDLLLPVLRKGFHDPYSNYGHYEGLVGDGLSEWHPAFLQLAPTLEGCARRYAHYCLHYRPQAKPARKSGWGSRLLQLDGGGSTAAAVGWRRGGSAAAGRMATAGGDIPQGQRGQGKQLGLDQRCHKWLQREEKKGGCDGGNSVLLRSAISENKQFEQLWRGAGVPANQWPPCSAAEGTTGGLKVPGIAQPAGRVGAVVLVTLMRFLSLRLKPKAVAAPKRGRGPGTDDAGGWGGWTAANVTRPNSPSPPPTTKRFPTSSEFTNKRAKTRVAPPPTFVPFQFASVNSPAPETKNPEPTLFV